MCGRLLPVREGVEQGAAPATLCVLRQAGLGYRHGEEPPAFLRAERCPLAANHGNLFVIGRLGCPGENAEFLAEETLHKIGASMPPTDRDLGGLESIVECVSGALGNAGPDGARQNDALLVTRDAVLKTTIPVILDDADRCGAGGGDLDAEDVRAKLLRCTEIHELDLLGHCSTSPVWSSMPSLSANCLRSYPEAKCALRKLMVMGVSGVNFSRSSTFLRIDSRNVAFTGTSPTLRPTTWLPWPTMRTTPSKVTALSPACLRPSKVLVRESSLRPVRDTRRPGFTSSIWIPFLPLAGKRNSTLVSRPDASAKARNSTSPSPISTGLSYSIPSRGSLPSSV